MGDDMEKEGLTVTDAAILAIIKEMTEAAADRVIAQRERAAEPNRRILTAGHLYLIIGCTMLLLVTAIGAFGGR